MGFQKKTGKGRIDKWYRLAKERGYRARAAFKLIQLNRRYGFLQKSQIVLDLCAAPGSWCQVAAETMAPGKSIIVGVDLAPIKPIPHVTTFQADITTEKCRSIIRQHLKSSKANTVLHDGAPNVGVAWVQDAYSQAELTLQALKLATEFLVPGGCFVTKLFRSKDSNALLWVLKQLFTRVEVTKPPSSRNVSAEIFVYCEGFKAPKSLDPKFLDPKAVFAELKNGTPNLEAKVFKPEKKRRKRDGYDEGDWTQSKVIPASEFIRTPDPISILGSYHRLNLDQSTEKDIAIAALNQLPETSDEIKRCCEDLQVIGRKEFKLLLHWRLKVRTIFGLERKNENKEEANGEENDVTTIEPLDDESQLQQDMESLLKTQHARRKRERRRDNEKKQKEIVRMQLNMVNPTDIGLEQDGQSVRENMFKIADLQKISSGDNLDRQDPPVSEGETEDDTSDEEIENDDALDEEMELLYQSYQQRKLDADRNYQSSKLRNGIAEDTFDGLVDEDNQPEVESDDDEYSLSDSKHESSQFLTRPSGRGNRILSTQDLSSQALTFFEQDIFEGIEGDVPAFSNSTHAPKETLNPARSSPDEPGSSGDNRYMDIDLSSSKTPQDQDDNSEPAPSDFELVRSHNADWNETRARSEGPFDIDIVTAEAMTLAHELSTGKKTTQGIIDDGFNKYSFRDTDGLPQWFLDDEESHSKPLKPMTAAAAAAVKEKLRALNARPIKKVLEAKERKKYKAARRLEKLRKKSALMAEEEGISEREKANNIAKLMARAAKKSPKPNVKVVVARGGNRAIMGRPRGVKGRYKIVDPRLKKDVRAEKRLATKRKH